MEAEGYGDTLPDGDALFSSSSSSSEETVAPPQRETTGNSSSLRASPPALPSGVQEGIRRSPLLLSSAQITQLAGRSKASNSGGVPASTGGVSKKRHLLANSKSRRRHFMSLTTAELMEVAAAAEEEGARAAAGLSGVPGGGGGGGGVASLELHGMDLRQQLDHLVSRVGAAHAFSVLRDLLVETGEGQPEVAERAARRVAKELRPSKTAEALQRKWNAEFQTLLGMPDSLDKYALLRALYNDFCYAADAYGRIIISERHIPDSMKTIRPATVGGIAGGEKFICQGILFKFSVDQQLSNGEWLYGIESPNDEAAMKVASNELTGLIHTFKCEIAGLHLPLMALIDYRGYRLTALAVLPIADETLIYGSNDGGKTVYSKTLVFAKKMEKIASHLNLQPHHVQGALVHGPADLEGHRGYDGRFYLIDYSRVFPPEAPAQQADRAAKRAIFYRLLRPELVRRSAVPLSSDAFSKFQQGDANDKQYNGQVRVATQMLYEEAIPQFALSLHGMERLEGVNLITTLHRAGINVRHLGHVRACLPSSESAMRRVLLSEMSARCIKLILRASMRERMKEFCLPSVEPYMGIVLEVFNLLFGWKIGSLLFWNSNGDAIPVPDSIPMEIVPLKVQLRKKFPRCLSAEEEVNGFNLRDIVDVPYVLRRVQRMLNITLGSTAVDNLSSASSNYFELSYTDVLSMGAKIKYLPLIDLYTGIQLSLEATQKQGSEYRRLVALAEERFKSSLASLPDHPNTYVQWGRLIHAVTMRSKSSAGFTAAIEKLRTALEIDSEQQEAKVLCAAVLVDFGFMLTGQAIEEHSRSLMRQALDRYAEALATSPSTAAPQLMKLAASDIEELVESEGPKLFDASIDFRYTLLAEILQMCSASVERARHLLASLNLRWAYLMLGAISFQDAAGDSLRVLKVAEKFQASLSCVSEEERQQLQGRIKKLHGIDLVRYFAVSRFCDALADAVRRRCEEMTMFHFTRLNGLSEDLLLALWEACPNLEEVLFSKCGGVTDALLGGMARHLPKLKKVGLSGCIQIQRDAIAELAASVGASLVALNLTLCLTADDWVMEELGSHCPELRRLSISKTRITSEGCNAFLKQAGAALELLDLAGCGNIRDSTLSAIASHCAQLRVLVLAGCPALTSKGIAQLRGAAALEVLDVSFCDRVDEKAFSSILKFETLHNLYMKGAKEKVSSKTLQKLTLRFMLFCDLTYPERLARMASSEFSRGFSGDLPRAKTSLDGTSAIGGPVMFYNVSLDPVDSRSRNRTLRSSSSRKSRRFKTMTSPVTLQQPGTPTMGRNRKSKALDLTALRDSMETWDADVSPANSVGFASGSVSERSSSRPHSGSSGGSGGGGSAIGHRKSSEPMPDDSSSIRFSSRLSLPRGVLSKLQALGSDGGKRSSSNSKIRSPTKK